MSVTYYIVREINWVILVAYAILEMLTVATSFFYFSHVTSYDKNGKFVGFFGVSIHLNKPKTINVSNS